jgi:tetratricopeptide (TPR) repeat protein
VSTTGLGHLLSQRCDSAAAAQRHRHEGSCAARGTSSVPAMSARTALHTARATALACCLAAAPAQGGDPATGTAPPATATAGAREAMWYAPTAADWQKPVRIEWQRTWDDAVRLSQQTRRPILVCVNMDGEIASEHYAGVRYRDAEIAKLYEPYVCVIASVYRHNPRDHDEQGRRIPCPRFGGCTCGEHIAMETVVFPKFLDGQRIAPRHIMVELDGSEAYDVYYAFDTASVLQTIGDGMKDRDATAEPLVRGDRSLLEKVQSPHSRDRSDVEAAWQNGDAEQRQALLTAAAALGEQAPVEVLRQAIYGLDPALAATARTLLARSTAPGAAALLGEVLATELPPAERQTLVAALERLGSSDPHARALAVVHGGLAERSRTVDAARWSEHLAGATYTPAPPPPTANALGELDRAVAVAPADPAVVLAQAEASLAAADGAIARQRRALLEDSRRAAARARQLGAEAFRADTVQALACHALGEHGEAYELAERAVAALPPDRSDARSAAVLFLFAEARQEAIVAAHREKREWPRQWLTDVHATYEVLARHPHGTDAQVAHHVDFLGFFGGTDTAAVALDAGLRRFPTSPALHERLRARILREQGVEALEATYQQLMAQQPPSATMVWFAAYAALVSAEHHRRRGEVEPALTAYDRGIERFERALALDAAQQPSCDHYVAVARAGRSRVHFERGELERAVDELLVAFTRCPDATPALDGLNLSGADTARMLQAATRTARPELFARLEAAMGKLDPELLRLPDYERQAPGTGRPPRRRRG